METKIIKTSPVFHIALGGSIEYIFSAEEDKMLYPKDSVVRSFFDELNILHSFKGSKTYALLESNEIEDQLIKQIVKYLTNTGNGLREKQILVTTGLNKIREIGDMFAQHLYHGNVHKIILVGSNIPLINRWYSDACFNLPYALSYLRYMMKEGEIVSFNGKEFFYHLS